MKTDQPTPAQDPQRVVSPEDKALASDWLRRINAALTRHSKTFKNFELNRKRLRGFDPNNNDKRLRTNLYFSNLASMRPQVYAKDPEFSVKPTMGVPEDKIALVQRFGTTAEAVLEKKLVRDADLKKRAKRQLTSTFTTSVGWLKCCWQQDKRTDVLITNQIKDIQDNIQRLEEQKKELEQTEGGASEDLNTAKLRETLAGLEAQAEVMVANGPTLDFALSEDILVIDESVQEVADYKRSGAIGHRVWMTPSQYKTRFKYEPKKSKVYSLKPDATTPTANVGQDDKDRALLCVWEVWDQESNRVFCVCEGEEGFCDAPQTPDWTGRRWYPFFLLAFNEVDGSFYSPSDVELIEPLVEEYNQNRDDLVRDRLGALPLNVIRKGSSLTDSDLNKLSNRRGSDMVVIEGVSGRPISDDIFSGSLGQLNPVNYDTMPARSDIEQLLGGGDASRGSVMKAKTATEAEILSQGLRSRSAERQDGMEDMLSELGSYVLEMCLRKMSLEEVKEIAGPDAQWPELTASEVFKQVTVNVMAGSTGKPDRLQEQDRWTKMLPVIQKALAEVPELRAKGAGQQAEAVIALVKETLRRFEERFDIDQFLPQEEGDGQDPTADPRVQQLMQQGQEMIAQLQEQVKALEQEVAENQAGAEAEVNKAQIAAARDVEIAEKTAPIKAEATVEVARVEAQARAVAQAQIASMQPAPVAEPAPEMQQVAQQVQEIHSAVSTLTDIVTQLAQPPEAGFPTLDPEPITQAAAMTPEMPLDVPELPPDQPL